MRIYLLSLIILTSSLAYSADQKNLPRFVSIKSTEVNARTGPNLRYPIKWVYVKKGEPVEIIAEFENWRKIRDYNNDESWIHESMIMGKRYGILENADPVDIFYKSSYKSKIIAKANKGVRIALNSCDSEWCKIQYEDIKGFVPRNNVYGIYKNEVIK